MVKIPIDLRFIFEFPYAMWSLEEYLKALEESLDYHQEQYPLRIKANLKRKGYKADDPEVSLASQKIYTMVDCILPRTFRSPFIVMLWAAFESLIRELAKCIDDNSDTRIKLSNLRGGLLNRAKIYFPYAIDFSLTKPPERWQKIKMLYSLRNAIAHGGGFMENLKDQDKIRKLEEQFGRFEIRKEEIILEKEYLREAYDLVNEMGSELIEEVKDKIG